MLQRGDVYVSDHFGLKQDGPSIGDNVGNAIYARSGNGIVYDGAVRDINGLKELPNFVSFVRSYDPSHHFGAMATGARLNSTMVGINGPIRIGKAKIGRAHVRTPVTNAHLVCRLLLEKTKKNTYTPQNDRSLRYAHTGNL